MCSNIRLSKSKSIKSGHEAKFKTTLGVEHNGVFGFMNGVIYNCRADKLSSNSSKWYGDTLKRGIIDIISFYEGGADFASTDGVLHAAVLYNDKNEFALITENSTGVVAKYHSRMPLFIDDSVDAMLAWFNEGRIIHLKPQLLRRAS